MTGPMLLDTDIYSEVLKAKDSVVNRHARDFAPFMVDCSYRL
jgi:hypothetical protein